MGKRRKMGKSLHKTNKQVDIFDTEDSKLDPTSRKFIYDEVDDYNKEAEDDLLRDVTFQMPKAVEKEQVLGVGGSSDSEDDDNDDDDLFMDDDIVDEEEDKLPDDRAWGKKKHLYYHTDTTDERLRRIISGGNGDDYEKLEGAAACKFQERLDIPAKDLPDEDLFIQAVSKATDDNDVEDRLQDDISLLSHKDKTKLLKKHSPEFFFIVKDFNDKSEELQNIIEPLMEARKAGKLTHSNLDKYITTRYQLLTNYITNLCAYLLLKSQASSLKQHPVIERLSQYRTLLQKLDTIHENILPKLKEYVSLWKSGKPLGLSDDNNNNSKKSKRKPPKKLLGILKDKKSEDHSDDNEDLSKMLEDSEDDVDSEEDDDSDGDVDKTQVEPVDKLSGVDMDSNDDMSDIDAEENNEEEEDEERRLITKEMAKNKGLIPSRRRDQQNPRVKYKMKYTKKLKLRKGQVRQVRNEIKKYSGEKSGINVRAVKSTKIK